METTNTLTFKSIRQDAWQLIKGMKGKIWLVMFYSLLVTGASFYITHMLSLITPDLFTSRLAMLLKLFIVAFPDAVFTGGLMMICVLHARGEAVTFTTWMRYAKYFVSVAMVIFISGVLENITLWWEPVASSATPHLGVTLTSLVISLLGKLFLMFAVIIVVDQNVNPFKACVLSAQLVWKNFKLSLGVFLFILVILLASIVIVPLIWTVPLAIMLVAVLYTRIIDKK